MKKSDVLSFIDENQKIFTDVSDKIWNHAETKFTEHKSMDEICAVLEDFGFKVEKGLADMPTAFMGTYGQGAPVIGILGEYDALPMLSQKEMQCTREELENGANGHGCGHNMLGAGALGAAVGLKEYLAKSGTKGTVVYFGCPAEEGGSGKAYMARAGLFSKLDAALTWHPSAVNSVFGFSMLANYQINYHYKGIASHAAASPHLGRSALDAVELMSVGANYLREHIIPEARLHYAILDAGGIAPNVVQPRATVTYLLRAPQNGQVEEIYQRINKIAQGAALMTETELRIEFIKSCSNIVNNRVLEKQMQKNFEEVGTPTYTEEELAFAKKMRETVPSAVPSMAVLGDRQYIKNIASQDIVTEIMPYTPVNSAMAASTDVGDASWNTPTAQIAVACYTNGTPDHSWQLVAQGKSSLAHKGLVTAAKVIAATAIDLFENAELVIAARKNFEEELDGATYASAIPADKKPPVPQAN